MQGDFIPLWLGIDIGGSKLALALGDEQGTLLAQRRRPSRFTRDPERDLAELADEARALCAEAGIAAPGRARGRRLRAGPARSRERRAAEPAESSGLARGPDAAPARASGSACPCTSRTTRTRRRSPSGASAPAAASSTSSTSRCRRGSAPASCSTGRLYAGKHGAAGEVGHAPVEWDGEPCACGAARLSRGLRRRRGLDAAPARARRPPASRVAALAGAPERARPEHVVAAAREGDAFALAELARYNDYLARGLTALVFMLAPEVVILGTIPTRRRRGAVSGAGARAGARARLAAARRASCRSCRAALGAAAAVSRRHQRRNRGAAG